MSQAYIGYDLQNALREEMHNRDIFDIPVATMVTQVRVDPEDPAFKSPTKPIGHFMTKEQAEHAAKNTATSSKKMPDAVGAVSSPLPFPVKSSRSVPLKPSSIQAAGHRLWRRRHPRHPPRQSPERRQCRHRQRLCQRTFGRRPSRRLLNHPDSRRKRRHPLRDTGGTGLARYHAGRSPDLHGTRPLRSRFDAAQGPGSRQICRVPSGTHGPHYVTAKGKRRHPWKNRYPHSPALKEVHHCGKATDFKHPQRLTFCHGRHPPFL